MSESFLDIDWIVYAEGELDAILIWSAVAGNLIEKFYSIFENSSKLKKGRVFWYFWGEIRRKCGNWKIELILPGEECSAKTIELKIAKQRNERNSDRERERVIKHKKIVQREEKRNLIQLNWDKSNGLHHWIRRAAKSACANVHKSNRSFSVLRSSVYLTTHTIQSFLLVSIFFLNY